MQTVRLSWTLPTVRESGKPFNPADADHVSVEMSADAGVTFVGYGAYPPDVLTVDVPDLEPGEWFFRGQCVDKTGLRGKFTTKSVVVPDTTAPGVITLDLALV
jgi:hypothetical protein